MQPLNVKLIFFSLLITANNFFLFEGLDFGIKKQKSKTKELAVWTEDTE